MVNLVFGIYPIILGWFSFFILLHSLLGTGKLERKGLQCEGTDRTMNEFEINSRVIRGHLESCVGKPLQDESHLKA